MVVGVVKKAAVMKESVMVVPMAVAEQLWAAFSLLLIPFLLSLSLKV